MGEMRTTNDIIEAARLGDPCTEEELRLAIISMRSVLVPAHLDNAKWSLDESLPPFVRMKAKLRWDAVNVGFNIPVDDRVAPHDRPGPEARRRKKVAEKVWKRFTESTGSTS